MLITLQELRRQVRLTLLEAIKSKKTPGHVFGDKFDWKLFKSLQLVDMKDYAEHFLSKLGEGSSRAAFTFSNKYVLKIATNDAGIAQNKAEVSVWTDPQTKEFINPILEFDDEYKWLKCDAVREVTEDDFEKMMGCDFKSWIEVLENLKIAGDTYIEECLVNKVRVPEQVAKQIVKNTNTILKIMDTNKLLEGDLENISHWGKSRDGHLVILDYGFDEEVYQKHYKKNKTVKKTAFDFGGLNTGTPTVPAVK